MRTLLLGLLSAMTLFAQAADLQSQARAQLHKLNDTFNQAALDGDAEALVALYAHDTLWIEQGKPVVQGLEAPRTLFEFVTQNHGQVSHTIDTLFVAEDSSMAVMIGSVDAKVASVGMDATGTYLFVLKPTGDEWKIVTDMWHQHQ